MKACYTNRITKMIEEGVEPELPRHMSGVKNFLNFSFISKWKLVSSFFRVGSFSLKVEK